MEHKEEKKVKKDFHKKGNFRGKKFDHKGKGFSKGKPEFKKRKLAPGVEFMDRELGVGIVRKLTDEGVVVAFGDVEKLIPKKKREFKKDGFHKDRKFTGKKEAFQAAKPMDRKVFTFDVDEKPAKEKPAGKREVTVGLTVVDDVLGKGVVSRITERGTYVTYEATGEHVMYPRGLTAKLLQSAFPKAKKEKKEELPKAKGRTYTVPEAPKRAAKKVEIRPVKETHRCNTHYFELGVGTPVHSNAYGKGVIIDIAKGHLTVDFGGVEKDFIYPRAFAEGEIEVIVEE